jgi:hypothetical protein
LQLAGETTRAGTVDIWYPTERSRPPRVGGAPRSAVGIRRVPGGFRITARVRARYSLTLAA